MKYETPLHRVTGMGSAHAGTGSFAYQRISAVILIPLSLWFAWTLVGLAGVPEATALIYFAEPLHAILMAVFILTALSHLALGLREILTDYVPHGGIKLLFILLASCFAAGVALVCFFSLLRIAL